MFDEWIIPLIQFLNWMSMLELCFFFFFNSSNCMIDLVAVFPCLFKVTLFKLGRMNSGEL